MSWNYSTGFQTAVLGGHPTTDVYLMANTISMTATTLSDSGSGLGSFANGDWIRVLSTSNKNVFAKVITAAAGSLTCGAATFTVESAGSYILVEKVAGGSYADIFLNSRLDLYSGGRPSDADSTETGTLLATITLDSGTFVSGSSENGLNFGNFASGYLNRATDPSTATTEVWSGVGLADGTAGWGRLYANTVVTGVSTSAVRKDGTVTTTTGGDIVMAGGRSVVTAAPVSVTAVNIFATGTDS